MGKINQGILGGVSGTVGTVVGGSWKGISYIRGKAQSVANPNSERQQLQRGKFSMVVEFLQPILGFVTVGYRQRAIKMSGFNAASSSILKNGVVQKGTDYALNYAEVSVSDGTLMGSPATVTVTSDGSLLFNWTNNTGRGNARSDDKVMMLTYFDSVSDAVFVTDGADRSATSDELVIPEDFSGMQGHCWIAFQSADGTKVSKSSYLGSYTVLFPPKM